MRYARVLDGIAVDVSDADPTDIFHPLLASQFVQVPDDVVTGSRWIDDAWVEPSSPSFDPASAPPRQLALIDFLRLFTTAEKAGFNALRKTVAGLPPEDYASDDPAVQALVGFEVGLTHYDALRAGLIELDNAETIEWLGLLVPLGVLTEARLAQVLAGEPPP